jgi:hypothetical protein
MQNFLNKPDNKDEQSDKKKPSCTQEAKLILLRQLALVKG